MSVQTEIDRISQNVANTYTVLDKLEADMPTKQNSDNLTATALTIDAKIEKIRENVRIRTGGTESLSLEDIAEAIMQIGEAIDLATMVYRTIGTTFPPTQLPASTAFTGYDIDILNTTADGVYEYIDNAVSDKNTVTKEIMGKDASNTYDIVRYIYAKREYFAWVRENYPKMYAWKNGDNIKYSESVSPRIGEKVYDSSHVETTGTQTITVPSKAAVLVGKRYSLSGGAFKDNASTSAIVLPLPKNITSDVSLTLVNMQRNTSYGHIYGGTSNNLFTTTILLSNDENYTDMVMKNTAATGYSPVSECSFVTFFVNSTGASGQYDNSKILVNGVEVPFEITTDPTIATQESTTIIEIEGGGKPITAVSATNRSRTVDEVEYVRYEEGDVEPTLIYTDKDDERNSNTSITEDGITYNRYPLGDLGANRKKLIPIFIYANEHGIIPDPSTTKNYETKMCALVASRLLRDFGTEKQEENLIYKIIRENCMLIIIPVANPFGYNMNVTGGNSANNTSGYYNANGCNINRNYDTAGWDVMLANGETQKAMGAYAGSENETQYIMNTMVESGAVVAMSLHGLGGWEGYCAHQGQNPNGDYNQTKLAKIVTFLKDNYGYTLRYYDDEPCMNTPDITSKSPSYITQCGAYGGIVEMSPDDVNVSGFVHEMKSNVIENAYAQTLNLMAMWLSDYLEQ